MRPTFAFTLIAASIAVTSAEPFIGKGHLTFSTYDNSGAGVFYHKVGCLQSTGQLTVDTSQCAIFNGSQIVIPNSLGYPPLIYGNLTAGNNVCGVDSNDSYYYIKCGPGVDALSAYWGYTSYIAPNYHLQLGRIYTDIWYPIGGVIPKGSETVAVEMWPWNDKPAPQKYAILWEAIDG